MVQRHHPHIICLQETKIQAAHEAELDTDETLLPDYCKFWASSVQKKGYSGTALFIQRALCSEMSSSSGAGSGEGTKAPPKGQKSIASFFGAPKAVKPSKKASAVKTVPPPPSSLPLSLQAVTRELPDARFAGEGRTITAEFDKFFLVNCKLVSFCQS